MKERNRRMLAVAGILLSSAVFGTVGCGKKAEDVKVSETQIEKEEGAEAAEGVEQTADAEKESEASSETAENSAEAAGEPAVLPKAGEVVKSGAWGEGTYTLDDKGILTLTGPGEVVTQEGQDIPNPEMVEYLVVEEGVTRVGGTGTHFPNLLYASYPSTIRYFRLDDSDKLTTVILAEGVTEFVDDAFHCCRSLTSLTVPSTVSRLGMCVFMNSGLKEIELPEEMTYIDSAFCYSPLESIRWPAGVDTIYSVTFHQCQNMTSITLPRDVKVIQDGAFSESGLKDVYYQGTEEEFKAIEIGKENEPFLNAEIHYNAE